MQKSLEKLFYENQYKLAPNFPKYQQNFISCIYWIRLPFPETISPYTQ